MSAGARIPLPVADGAAAFVLDRWGLTGHDAVVVGSVRRRKLDVGDIEICMPWEPPERDEFYKTLHASAGRQGGLFGGETDLLPLTIVKGVKAGFKQAAVIAHVVHQGTPLEVPVEIYRFEPGARAWSLIMRTGPAEFGRWFLGRWKRQFSIPTEQPASVEGCLVDRYGKRVPIDDEVECFRRCGIGFVAPDRRDAFMESLRGG